MKLNLIIQGIDKLTAPLRKIERSTNGLGTMLKRTTGDATRAGRALDGVGRSASGAVRGVSAMAGRVAALAGQGGLLALRKSADVAKSALSGTLAIAGRVGVGVGLAGVAGIGLFANSMIGIAGRFEQMQIQLEGLLGSSAKAKAAMSWVQTFAQKTPYELEEVTAAFVRAKGVGIDPMSGALRKMGDAASGNNKTLIDAVEAVADAQTGEFERLKEFLITGAAVKGNRVQFSYLTKAGKSASKTVKKDMAAIREAVLSIFDERNGGGMERQSKTLFGIWNNLKDLITKFQIDIANAGIFDFIKAQLQDVYQWMDNLNKNGDLGRLAKRISKQLVELGTTIRNFFKNTDWDKVGVKIRETAEGIWYLAKGVAFLARAAATWQKFNVVTNVSDFARSAGRGLIKGGNIPTIAQPTRSGPRFGPAIGGTRGIAAPGAATRVGGSIDIRVFTDPDSRMRMTTTTTNPRVPINVHGGRSMAEYRGSLSALGR